MPVTLDGLPEKQVHLEFHDTPGDRSVTVFLFFFRDSSAHQKGPCAELGSGTTAKVNGHDVALVESGGAGSDGLSCVNAAAWRSAVEMLETGPITLEIADGSQTVTLTTGPLVAPTLSTDTDLAGAGVHAGDTVRFTVTPSDYRSTLTPTGCIHAEGSDCAHALAFLEVASVASTITVTLPEDTPPGTHVLRLEGAFLAGVTGCGNAVTCTALPPAKPQSTPIKVIP